MHFFSRNFSLLDPFQKGSLRLDNRLLFRLNSRKAFKYVINIHYSLIICILTCILLFVIIHFKTATIFWMHWQCINSTHPPCQTQPSGPVVRCEGQSEADVSSEESTLCPRSPPPPLYTATLSCPSVRGVTSGQETRVHQPSVLLVIKR